MNHFLLINALSEENLTFTIEYSRLFECRLLIPIPIPIVIGTIGTITIGTIGIEC